MKRRLAELDRASLEELMAQHPAAWREVGEALVAATAKGPEAVKQFVEVAHAAARLWHQRIARSHGSPQVLATALPQLVASRMALLAAQRTLFAAATGRQTGAVRLGLWSGTIIQKLLFAGGLARKPVSLGTFKRVWPLVTQRRLLMPLVQQKGIYCFYSRELVQELVAAFDGREALELAAGDGTLARFLTDAGAKVRATDDASWSHAIAYPPAVERLAATKALARHAPKVVVCSFPPPGNTFEREVFRTASVELYLVVTTRHRFAAGDWGAYEAQRDFDWQVDERLSRLVLPPELDPAVLVFRRRAGPGAR